MRELELKSVIKVCNMDELSAEEKHLVELAIEATSRSYAPYSKFHVGAAVRLDNGVEIIGCNQENAAYPSGLCAERTALFAAGAQYPDVPVRMLAIAARNTEGNSSPIAFCMVKIRTRSRLSPSPSLSRFVPSRPFILMKSVRSGSSASSS